MTIQTLPNRSLVKLPPSRTATEPCASAQDTVAPSRWQKIGHTALKGARGAAAGFLPAAAAGYAAASWGGIPGAIVGGCLGAGLGFLSGREIREVAEKMAAKHPDKLNVFHKGTLKIGPAAPYLWAAFSGALGALAGATFAPVIAALCFGKKGMVAGALIMGTKTK